MGSSVRTERSPTDVGALPGVAPAKSARVPCECVMPKSGGSHGQGEGGKSEVGCPLCGFTRGMRQRRGGNDKGEGVQSEVGSALRGFTRGMRQRRGGNDKSEGA